MWNLRIDNESITSKQIGTNLTYFYGTILTLYAQRQLEMKIKQKNGNYIKMLSLNNCIILYSIVD